jgi:predicted TPR repeat methyltransferase
MSKKQPSGALATVSSGDGYVNPKKVYDNWSASYDADLIEEYGYVAPQMAADELARRVSNKNATIIDLGCGTGLAGRELRDRGYYRVDGADISTGMLSQARRHGVYRQLFTADLTQRTSIPDATYDTVISVGAFGNGHLKAAALPHFIRLVKPGGYLVIYLNARPFISEDYPRSIHELELAGLWHVKMIEASNYMKALNRPGRLVVAQRPY